MKYYLIAGEASGDLHGSNLMKGLKRQDPQAQFRFWGGEKMAAVGGELVRHYKEAAVMGLIEVLAKIGTINKNLRDCKADILSYQPDVVILVDYPGFNFRIAKFAHKHNIKTFYYIAPKVWAWKEHRVNRLRRYVDQLFIIFPFEIDYFKSKGIDALYKGNPLIDSISQDEKMLESRGEFLRRNSLEDRPIVALLAGSRQMEIKFLMPIFLELERLMSADSHFSNYQLLLAGAPSVDLSTYSTYLKGSNIKLLYGETYSILKNAEVAAINSGTASLEAAIISVPQVVCYGMNPISFAIAKCFVKIKYISLANIIMDKHIFKELLQRDCTAQTIFSEIRRLTLDKEERDTMIRDYEKLKVVLGGEGSSDKIAESMVSILKK